MGSELLQNQLNSKPVEDKQIDDDKAAKVKKIIERAIEKAENSPKCSPEEIWQEFDTVWDKISSQSQP
jgi:TPP-dependent pyruvate/acetoin dehydrogenase alpha subunit